MLHFQNRIKPKQKNNLGLWHGSFYNQGHTPLDIKQLHKMDLYFCASLNLCLGMIYLCERASQN